MSLDNFTKRTSVKNFTKEKMTEAEITKITEVINNSPTSYNHQQFSAIIVTKQKFKDMICTNNYNQQHIKDSAIFIIFLADRTKTAYALRNNNLTYSKEYKYFELVRLITDPIIAATYAQDALIEMGYGTTMIGGILGFIDKLNVEFNIPKTAIPILGLSVGKAVKINVLKPKVNKVFINEYNKKQSLKQLKKYSKNTKEYFENIGEKAFLDQIIKSFEMMTNSNQIKQIGQNLKKIFLDMFEK